jgi:hypothetical protein
LFLGALGGPGPCPPPVAPPLVGRWPAALVMLLVMESRTHEWSGGEEGGACLLGLEPAWKKKNGTGEGQAAAWRCKGKGRGASGQAEGRLGSGTCESREKPIGSRPASSGCGASEREQRKDTKRRVGTSGPGVARLLFSCRPGPPSSRVATHARPELPCRASPSPQKAVPCRVRTELKRWAFVRAAGQMDTYGAFDR